MGRHGQTRADTEPGPDARTSKYVRRPMPKVDFLVPGQHLREDVLVGGFSKSTLDRCRSRTMMTRLLHLSKSGFNYTYWLGSTKKLAESIPGCRGRGSYQQVNNYERSENRTGRGKEWGLQSDETLKFTVLRRAQLHSRHHPLLSTRAVARGDRKPRSSLWCNGPIRF